jgi:hypothetical protein
MRTLVKEHNIYWWAGCLIGALCELRLEQRESAIAYIPDRIPMAASWSAARGAARRLR